MEKRRDREKESGEEGNLSHQRIQRKEYQDKNSWGRMKQKQETRTLGRKTRIKVTAILRL